MSPFPQPQSPDPAQPGGDYNPITALNAVNNAVRGKVDPGTVVAVVKSAKSIDEATTNVQAIAHSGNMMKAYDSLGKMSPSEQASAWQGMQPAEQRTLQAIGYQPPNLDALNHAGGGGQHGGIWSDIISGASSGLHRAATATGSFMERGLGITPGTPGRAAGMAVTAAGVPLSGVQHIYRAADVLGEMGEEAAGNPNAKVAAASGGTGFHVTPSQFSDIFSPHAWSQAWTETNDGNTDLDPAQNRQLIAQHGQQQVSLAIRVGNLGVDAVVSSAPSAQRQTLLNQVQDPKFQQLVNQVNNAKLSVGRLAVGSSYMNSHPTEGRILSGTIDAVTDIASDPTLKLGKTMEAYKIAKYGVSNASDIADLIRSDPSVARWVQHVGSYVSQGRYGELAKVEPRLAPVVEELQRSGVDSTEKFAQWMSDVGGENAIMRGQVAKISHGITIMPHMTYLGWMKNGVKEALGNGIDRLADGPVPDALGAADHPTDIAGVGDAIHAGTTDTPVAHAIHVMEMGKQAADVGKISQLGQKLNVARLVRKMDTFIPSKPYIPIATGARDEATGIYSGGADPTNFIRLIQGFLPAHMVKNVADVYVGADEGERRLLASAAIKQQFHAAGLYNTPTGAAAADAAMDEVDSLMRDQAYSVNGYDTLPDDSNVLARHAVLETQKSDGMAIPTPSMVRKLVRAHGVLSAAGVPAPMNMVDSIMNVWRRSVLDRPGFAVRMALDENLNRLLRTNPKQLFASWVSQGAAQTRSDADIAAEVDKGIKGGEIAPDDRDVEIASRKAMAVKPFAPYHPVEKALQILSNRAPEGIRPHVQNAAQWYGAVFGGATRQWARKAERGGLKALGMEKYIEAATHLATHQPVMEAASDVLATGTGDDSYRWSPETQVKEMRLGGKSVIAKFNNKAPFSQASVNTFGYHFKWQVGLDQIANSRLARASLETIDKTRDTQMRAVLKVLNDPAFAEEKKGFVWSTKMRDGRSVGVDATQEEADRAFARQVVDHVNAHLRSGVYSPSHRGTVLSDLVDEMKRTGAAPEMDKLEGIGGTDLPAAVYGPDVVPVSSFRGFWDKTFEQMVGKPMNWMARQPHFIHQYADALEQARPFAVSRVGEGENAEKLASDVATQRAVAAMIPYIHNPELRTQFEEYHRNLFPFLFAQRQFLQRWGRTFADSPSAVREIQLTMNGLRTTGIIHRDANGNDYFYYPGSQYVTEMVSSTLNQLGLHATVPFAAPFTGEIKYLMPGLANPVTPSVGPFAAIGMKEFEKLDPSFASVNQAVLGQGATESPLQQFSPTIVNRIIAAVGPASAGSEKASTMLMGMKYLDNAGLGLPNNPTRGQTELYIDRLNHWATQLMLTRAVLGFVLPATPTAQLDPKGIDARYKELLTLLPYDQATAQFIKEHPNATAYTVGGTEAQTEGGLPSTEKDLEYTNAHPDFAKNYPAAFPWLAPRSPGTFSLTEFLEQQDTGQRESKPVFDPTPGSHSMVTDIINARASGTYYESVDNYEKAYTAAANSQERSSLTHAYDQWKAGFMARNPIFGEYIDSQAGKVSRDQTLNQVRTALKDPSLPDSPAVPALRVMMESYDNFVSADEQYAGLSSAAAYTNKKALQTAALAWGNDYITSHAAVADFWTTIVRPQIEEQG